MLSVIHSFCDDIRTFSQFHPTTRVVVCPQDISFNSLSNSFLLCGAYLLVCSEFKLHEVLDTFKDGLTELAEREQLCSVSHMGRILNSWEAIDRAVQLHWLGNEWMGEEQASTAVLDVEMAAHYAMAANGGIDVLVPGKLLLIPSPCQLPHGCDWLDDCEPEKPPSRRFSAAFLADLLADLGASAAVCLGRTDGRDAAALRGRGLDVHDLLASAARPRQPGCR